MRKRIICIALLFSIVMLTGCSAQGMDAGVYNLSVWSLPELWYNFGIIAKRWAAVLIVVSLLLGMILYDVFKKNREIQKWAFSVLVVKIPLITFVLVYLYSAIYGAFNL